LRPSPSLFIAVPVNGPMVDAAERHNKLIAHPAPQGARLHESEVMGVRRLPAAQKRSPLSSAQIRAARALLRWSAEDLAQETALGVNTIRRAEVAEEAISLTTANDLAIRRALESAGVEFIDENGGGPGVRLRKSAHPRANK
jgi:hypothetical protein